MRFRDPLLLLLILILPFIVWLRVVARKRSLAVPYPFLGPLKGYAGGVRSKAAFLAEKIWVPGLILLIVALAGPQVPEPAEGGSREGIDMVLAIDTSGSMRTVTEGRSRLATVKEISAEFLRGRGADRIGLVAFAGDAVMVSPLTHDHAALRGFVKGLRFGVLPPGTALGTAVAVSADLLREGEARSRIIILLSDGINNSGTIDPVKAANVAKALGIRVYTVEEGRSVDNRLLSRQVNLESDADLLKEVARISGGRNFKIPHALYLAAVYDEIDRLEKERLKKENYAYRDVVQVPAIMSMALLIFGSFLQATRFRRLV